MNRKFALLVLFAIAACETSGGLSARATYNRGVNALAAGKLDDAEARFTKAMSESGPDPDLRYRAALNLGLTYARKADALVQEKPQEAIEELRNSANWFRDAIRLRENEKAPRTNLELVVKRMQALIDKLDNFRGLKPQLDKLIADQRTLYDRLLKLLTALNSSGASDPGGFAGEFADLATFERTLLAETRTVSELAADEAKSLEDKPEDQRTAEESGELVQLKNLDYYLQKARGSLADARRELRRLEAERSLSRAGDALENLKRAREQLLDPVAVLRGITEEQGVLLQHTAALNEFKKRGVSTDDSNAEPVKPPPWLTPERLSQRQNHLALRLTELTARFRAGANSEAPADADPKQKRALEMAKRAVPTLAQAETYMGESSTALAATDLEQSLEKQQAVLLALYQGIEFFADIKLLVELTHGSQQQAVALLSPSQGDDGKLTTAERPKQLGEIATRNLDRLERLKGLFADEVATLEAQQSQGQAAAGQPGQPAPGAQNAPSPEQIESQLQLYAHAEELRGEANTALTELAEIVSGKSKGNALASANVGAKKLEELRRLFFNVVEHLEDLIAQQEETRDSTASAQSLADDQRLEKFGPLLERQSRHSQAGTAIETALAELADQSAQNPQPQEGGPPPKFAEAAEEMRTANPHLAGAKEELSNASEQAATASVSLDPSIEQQDKALEHLRAALALLKPPKQQDQDQEQDQEENKEQEQQQDEQKPEDMSKQQAEQRLQEAREREDERRRKQKAQQPTADTVEKDW